MAASAQPYPYRVFLSYSSDDKPLAEQLVKALRAAKLTPVWDKDLQPGQRFTDAIRAGITHAHVFMPLLTESSSVRPWVHQETGYAIAMEVPPLPIAVGAVPDVMISDLEAHKISDLSEFDGGAVRKWIDSLMSRREEIDRNLFTAPLAEMRAEKIAALTREALDHRDVVHGPFRQRGAFSSFVLPNEPPDSDGWVLRDGKVQRSEHLYGRLYDERQSLEEYTRLRGCRLIIDPSQSLPANGDRARAVRLNTVLRFLQDESVEQVEVVVHKHDRPGSLTIVGDWFSALSTEPKAGKGYQNTRFTCHAKSVLHAIRDFDAQFERLLAETVPAGGDSRQVATAAVEGELEKLREAGVSSR
jgi:hypothetical protein